MTDISRILAAEAENQKPWTPIEPTTEAEKIVAAIHALNRSWDRRLEKLTDAVLLLVKTLGETLSPRQY
jgi:hypothetical protein